MGQDNLKKTPANPRHLFLLTLLGIFIAESFLMVVLHWISLSVWHEVLVDPILLTLVVFPLLYRYMFRPLKDHIEEREKKEDEQRVLITALQGALDKVKVLSGLLPTCAGCKKIKDDEGNWVTMEKFITERTEASFTHSLCEDCLKRLYPDEYKRMSFKK